MQALFYKRIKFLISQIISDLNDHCNFSIEISDVKSYILYFCYYRYSLIINVWVSDFNFDMDILVVSRRNPIIRKKNIIFDLER